MFCKHCGQQLADNATFCGQCGTPVVQQAPAAYGAPYGVPGQPPNIPTHLVGAILTTIFCCQIAGIVSIVYAGAMASSKSASTWMWIGVIVGGLINIVAVAATVIPAIIAASAE